MLFVFNMCVIYLDDEFGEKTVSILLDGEESEMVFIDHPSSEMSVRKHIKRISINVKNDVYFRI